MPEVGRHVAGAARGRVLLLGEPLSFWGGVDPATGQVIDRRHPRRGASVTGRVLVMPSGRGSSSSSTVLAESVRLGTAPAAIVLSEPDEVIALGALVAEELYGTTCPVLVVPGAAATVEDGMLVEVGPAGVARIAD